MSDILLCGSWIRATAANLFDFQEKTKWIIKSDLSLHRNTRTSLPPIEVKLGAAWARNQINRAHNRRFVYSGGERSKS
jgi:hypothetical protein